MPTRRCEVLDRAFVWDTRHVRQVPPEFEILDVTKRLHQRLNQAAPLRAIPAHSSPIPAESAS